MFDSEHTSVLSACSSGFFRNISHDFIVRKSEIGFLLVGARISDIVLFCKIFKLLKVNFVVS